MCAGALDGPTGQVVSPPVWVVGGVRVEGPVVDGRDEVLRCGHHNSILANHEVQPGVVAQGWSVGDDKAGAEPVAIWNTLAQ